LLVDIQMPVLDGIEATRQLRSRGFVQPILALTAHAMREDRMRSLDAGCNDHIAKPIDPRLLVAAVAHHTGATAH
jgi:two-component system CheB/CheR fusion protein